MGAAVVATVAGAAVVVTIGACVGFGTTTLGKSRPRRAPGTGVLPRARKNITVKVNPVKSKRGTF